MSATQDYVALDWIKGEIAQTLDQAQQALESVAQSPDDASSMRACLTHIHQVHGTLRMVQLHGPTLLSAEMEELAQALMSNEVPDVGKAQEMLMQAILQMPGYLDRIHKEQKDSPHLIRPVINNLRIARGEARLPAEGGDDVAEAGPDLSALVTPASAAVVTAYNQANGVTNVRKLRQRYQQALVALLKKSEPRENLGLMGKVFAMLIKLCGESPAGNLALLGLAVVEGISAGAIKLNGRMAGHLKAIDGELKRLVEAGDTGLSNPVSEELGEALLAEIQGATRQTPKIEAALGKFIRVAASVAADEADEKVSFGPDDETIAAVAGILIEEFRGITDKLDLYVRASPRKADSLIELLPQLEQIKSTLSLVGLGDHQQTVQQQIVAIRALQTSNEVPNDDALLDMARAFLEIESSLKSMVGVGDDGDGEKFGSVSEAEATVIKETRNGLAKCKDTVIEYVTARFDKAKIVDLAPTLKSLRGGLVIINQARSADVLLACGNYVEQALMGESLAPSLGDMDDLADAVTSIDYFLERYLENPKDPYLQMITVAETAITKLGFPPGKASTRGAAAIPDKANDRLSSTVVLKAAPPKAAEAPADAEVESAVDDTITIGPEVEHVDAEKAEPLPEIEPEVAELDEFDELDKGAPAESDLIDDEILEIFVEEVEEVLGTIAEFFPQWRTDPADVDSRAEIRRAFHTLKGSGRMVGATVVGELAWAIENMLNQVLDDSISASPAMFDLIEAVLERIPEGIETFRQGEQERFIVDELVARAEALTNGEDAEAMADTSPDGEDVPDEEPAGEEVEFDESLFVVETAAYEANETVDAEELEELERLEELQEFEEAAVAEELDEVEAESQSGIEDVAELTEPDELAVLELEEISLDELEEDSVSELDEIFREEASDRLAIVHDYLQAPGTIAPDLIAAFHTLKGSAGMAGVGAIARIAAPLEALANLLYQQGGSTIAFDSLCHQGATLIDSILADLDARRDDTDGLDAFVQAATDQLQSLQSRTPERPSFDFANIRLLSTADDVLAAWDESQVNALILELREVVHQAEAIHEASLRDLADALLTVYGHLNARPDALIAATMAEAHEHLVTMFDAIAASQEVIPAESVVSALRELDLSPPPIPAEPAAEVGGALPADDIDEEVLAIFLEEAEELIENIDQSILDWSGDPGMTGHLDNLLRHLHTMKGGARIAGLASLGEYTHNFESLLINLRTHPVPLDEAFFARVNQQQDEITRRVGIYTRVIAGTVTEEDLASMRFSAAPGKPVSAEPVAAAFMEVPPEESATAVPAATVAELPPDQVDDDVLPIFLEEAEELVESIDQGILDWSNEPLDPAHLNNLLRHLHTMKGGSRLAGLASLGEFTHNFETFLIGVQSKPVDLDEAFFASVNQQGDEISRRVGIYKLLSTGEATPEQLASMRTAAAPGNQADAPAAAPGAPIAAAPEPAPVVKAAEAADADHDGQGEKAAQTEMVRVSSDLLEELISLAGESSITRGRVEQQITDFGEALEEMEETINRIREQVRRLEIETESRETVFRSRGREDERNSAFDDLEMDRYTMLQEISRALSEGSSDMLDLKDTLVNKSRDAETLLHQQARIGGELQEGLTRTRMVPFARLIPRLRRIVRQVSAEVGKSVRFDAYNVEGELDRNVLERIVAPLEHMLRNAVDHGIEPVEKRRAAGKPDQGRISLRLSREGGYVVLTVSDDGGGINVPVVRAKAIERGLITADSQVSDREVRQFIMAAGFSTAQKLTQISGRGVGMDVVTSEIKQLGGTVEIDSEFGFGTEFTIQIPFTVSINRALMVVVQDETYAVPLNTIEGIVRVSPYELEAYYQPDAPMFEYAGQPYKLGYMGKMLEKSEGPNLEGHVTPLPVILARSGDNAVALQVDKVIGSREVIQKSLGPQFNEVRGVSGATVLGDGSVVVILDVMALVREAEVIDSADGEHDAKPVNRVRTVMIVDDSVTVRKVTSRLMERQGWEVRTAKDGIDAMNQLQETYPDVVLLDIEMPRMDGFEVLRSVRRDGRLKDLPIVMITSRTGEKHQRQALELGVNRFLGKPFQEANLLVTIEEVLQESQGR